MDFENKIEQTNFANSENIKEGYHNVLMERNFFKDKYAEASKEAGRMKVLINKMKIYAETESRISKMQSNGIELLKVRHK